MKRFISFLGTGNYVPCQYRLGDRPSPVVTYVQTATSLFADPRCDEAVVFCTDGARAKHAAGLLAEFAAKGLPPPQLVQIPDGASEAQLWEIFRIVRDVVGEGDEIVFDVTHSFRSLPVIATVLLRYLAVAKGVSLGACQYGAWEAKNERQGMAPEAPIFDLTPFFALDDWTRAIDAFEEFGDPTALKGLAARRLGPLCRSQESARNLNATIKTMSLFAQNARLANLGTKGREDGIRNMPLQSSVARPLAMAVSFEDLPELRPILERTASDFASYGDRDLRNGFRAARWAAGHGLLPQAYTLLQETTVSLVLERNTDIGPCAGGDIDAREFVSSVLSLASNPGYDWADWEYDGTRDDAVALSKRLPRDLTVGYARLTQIRNTVNHAGTCRQEPIKANAEDFGAAKFFTLADAIERSLAAGESPEGGAATSCEQ